jgi:chemotaxis protein methyltransferase CheR
LLPIDFRRVNLANAGEIATCSHAPVIFCRNVFIYFSTTAIQRTVNRFAEGMPDNGHLFVGASESLLKLNTSFNLQEINGAFVYVRRPRNEVNAA